MAHSGRRAAGRRFSRRAARFALLAFALACALPNPAAAREALALDAPKAVETLLKKHLSVLSGLQPGALDDEFERLAIVRRARREVSALLATEGYFAPEVALERRGEGWRLRVVPGERAMVSRVSLALRDGNVLGAEERAAWLERFERGWRLKRGEPFTQSAWDAGKSALVEAMSRRVFAAARISASRAEVDPEAASVALQVEVDPGPRYYFGGLSVSGLELYRPELVSRYGPPAPGEPYDEDRLLAFQSALQNTPYFGSALVEIDRDVALAEASPVSVVVSESKPKRVTLDAGFSTNTGYRAELGYRNANLFGRAWQLVSGLRVEQKELLLFSDIFLPPSGRGYQDSFGGLHERSDLEGLKLSREALGVTRAFSLRQGELGVSVKYQRERTEPDGGLPGETHALTGDVSATWRQVNDVLRPRSGFVASARVGGAGKAFLSTQNFVRAVGRLQAYFPVGERDVLGLRAELGKTFATSRDGVPQDFLFRAGGSQSLRGYAYRGLGVREGAAVVGGRYLAAASAEYTRWRPDGLGWAAFVDAGNVADDVGDFRIFTGYGVGARWNSPAGPLALDLAYGHHERRFRLHFAILVAY